MAVTFYVSRSVRTLSATVPYRSAAPRLPVGQLTVTVVGNPRGTPVVANWCDRGLSWLLAQFANQPRIRALLCLLLDRVQQAEQLMADLLALRSLDLAFGAQLDEIGVKLGFAREPETMTNAVYRQALRAVARARVSSGSANSMALVAQDATALPAADLTHFEDYPAGIVIYAGPALSYEAGHRAAVIIRMAKPTAVRFGLDYVPAGQPIISFDDDTIHPIVPFGDLGDPTIGGVFAEFDAGV